MKLPKTVRLIDIANETGISIATISRFLNGKRIRLNLRTKLEEYFKANQLEEYITSPSDSDVGERYVGLIVPDCNSFTFSSATNGVLAKAEELGYSIISTFAQGKPEREHKLLRSMQLSNIQGLIYTPLRSDSKELSRDLAILGDIPVVVPWCRDLGLPRASYVYSDNIESAYRATKYLLNLGRRNIGIILGSWLDIDTDALIQGCENNVVKSSGISAADRFAGYLKALKEYGIPFSRELIATSKWDHNSAVLAASSLLQSASQIDAILAASDQIGAVAMQIFRSHGYQIPEDISIISWNNSTFASVVTPTLTSIKEQPFLAGYLSLELIDEQLNGKKPRNIALSTEIIPRNSTSVKQTRPLMRTTNLELPPVESPFDSD